MSLIVARKVNKDIFLVSDTKLTSLRDQKLYSNFETDHVIKVVILNSQLVFAFAGNPEIADDALKAINDLKSIDSISKALLNYHLESFSPEGYSVEFLIAIGDPSFEIIEYKNGKINYTESSWLGDKEGFSLFQGYMQGEIQLEHESLNKEVDNSNFFNLISDLRFVSVPTNKQIENDEFSMLYSRAFDAMENVIKSEKNNFVGGFCLPVAYSQGEFSYMSYSSYLYGKEKVPFVPNTPMTNTLSLGSKPIGSHHIQLICEKNAIGKNQVAFYFLHGEFGITYLRENFGLHKPFVFSNCGSIEFSFLLKEKYSLAKPPLVGNGFFVNDFLKYGKKLFELNKFEQAIEVLDFGIKQCKDDSNVLKLHGAIASHLMKQSNFKAALVNYYEYLIVIETTELCSVYHSMAVALIEIKKYALSIKYLNKVIVINFNHGQGEAFYNRSIAFYHLASKQKSILLFDKGKKDLDNANKLGYKNTQLAQLDFAYVTLGKILGAI